MNITIQLAQSILNYLTTKPYQEVYVMIAELQRQANIKHENPEVKNKDAKKS